MTIYIIAYFSFFLFFLAVATLCSFVRSRFFRAINSAKQLILFVIVFCAFFLAWVVAHQVDKSLSLSPNLLGPGGWLGCAIKALIWSVLWMLTSHFVGKPKGEIRSATR